MEAVADAGGVTRCLAFRKRELKLELERNLRQHFFKLPELWLGPGAGLWSGAKAGVKREKRKRGLAPDSEAWHSHSRVTSTINNPQVHTSTTLIHNP